MEVEPSFALEKHELGSGGYGKVVIARNTATGEKVAAKLISTTRMKRSAIEKEVKLMGQLKHKHIIGLKGAAEEGQSYIIYMELATGGELFSRVISTGSLSEDAARPYFAQLMLAVAYMHENGVVHRDLKLENILLDEYGNCKVCDFGLAHVYDKDPASNGFLIDTKLREVCGSKSYCAPEVLAGRGYVGFPTDVWSCGICLFAMLAGFFPLDEASGGDWRYERVKNAAANGASTCETIFGFYERPCTLSKPVVELIDGMMAIRPERVEGRDGATRLSVVEVLSAPWLQVHDTLRIAQEQLNVNDALRTMPSAYRGGNDLAMNADDLRAMLMAEQELPTAPVYRAAVTQIGLPPPPGALSLKKQAAFGDDFIATVA